MSVLEVLTYIDVAAVPTGDRERSIDVIDDLCNWTVTHRSWKVTATVSLSVSQ